MSRRNNRGQHWKFNSKGPSFILVDKPKRNRAVDDPQVKASVDAVPVKEQHKCGGKVYKVAGLPRIHGEWYMCSKCSADVRR